MCRLAVGSTQLLFQSVLGYFAQVKWLGCKPDHSPPSSAEDKNELSCISSLTVSLHGVHRDSFAFLHVCCPAGLLNFFQNKDHYYQDKT